MTTPTTERTVPDTVTVYTGQDALHHAETIGVFLRERCDDDVAARHDAWMSAAVTDPSFAAVTARRDGQTTAFLAAEVEPSGRVVITEDLVSGSGRAQEDLAEACLTALIDTLDRPWADVCVRRRSLLAGALVSLGWTPEPHPGEPDRVTFSAAWQTHDEVTPVGRREVDDVAEYLAQNDQVVAPNYSPLPVVIAKGDGVWLTDITGRKYLDALSGYSALNFGHNHPVLIDAATRQLRTLTLTSRAFHSDQLATFCTELAALCGKDMVLPMNTGAEAVESAVKVARRWGYQVKGIPAEQAKVIVMDGNFHGRTTTIVSFSTDPDCREHFGPFTPGFDVVPYGDVAALEAAIDENTCAVLLEPIQGEGGVVIPPEGFLRTVRELCTSRQVLMIADEIQSGLGRTGRTFACDHEDVVPDLYVLGKALGGGVVPVSAVVGNKDILGVLTPGSHGSTFGGNPLAAAVGTAVVRLLATGEYQDKGRELGAVLEAGLRELIGNGVVGVRCRGLWAGVDIDPALMTGKKACLALADRGVLAKDTHGSTIRLAPPLVASENDIRFIVQELADVLDTARRLS